MSKFYKGDIFRIILPQIDENMIKVLWFRFLKCLGPFNMLTLKGSSETPPFREWSHELFDNLYFRKYISYDDFLFFENVSNLIDIPEMEQKI